MIIRVALTVAAISLSAAPAATAGMPRLIKEPVIGCALAADAAAIARLYKSDPAGAGALAEKKGCEVLPAGLRVSMIDADVDTLTARVVPFGEKKPFWIPTGKTISAD